MRLSLEEMFKIRQPAPIESALLEVLRKAPHTDRSRECIHCSQPFESGEYIQNNSQGEGYFCIDCMIGAPTAAIDKHGQIRPLE